jgi:uncharacterized protein (TIGR03437 family)
MMTRFAVAFCAFSTFAFGQGPPPLFGFLRNSGQFPPAIRFIRHDYNSFLYVTSDSLVLFNGIRVQIAAIAPDAQPVGDSPTTTVYNFYQGNHSSQWATHTPMFGAVKLNNVYPGVTAAFTTSTTQALGIGLTIEQAKLTFTIAPGADPSPIQVGVLNTGTSPAPGPGGIWFTGGRVQGVFNLTARATQNSEGASTSVTCNWIINPSGTLSFQLPDRNPSLETDVAITFPVYGVITAPATPGFLSSAIQYPSDFGQDGAIPNATCGTNGRYCTDAVIAKIDGDGNPTWVTVFGGSDVDYTSGATASQSGIAVSGKTSSTDFPVTVGAPHSTLGSPMEVFLAYFDGATGELRNSTYAGLPGPAYVDQQLADSAGNAVVGGGYATADGAAGFVLAWQPQQNRFVYSRLVADPVVRMVLDASSNLYFYSYGNSQVGSVIDIGGLDSSGKPLGPLATINLPPTTQPGDARLQPAGSNNLWFVYNVDTTNGGASLWAARILPALGQVAVNSRVSDQGGIANTGVTPSGNLKVLIAGPAPAEVTSPDAQLAAACPNSSYFMVLSPMAQLVYATYVPAAGFDFDSQNESNATLQAAITCFQSTAGRVPSTYAAPGELITITGAGFGPLSPVYTAPGPDGMYPLTASGFSVTIGALNAPIVALARGLIAVQVPFEVATIGAPSQPIDIEVSQGGQAFPPIPLSVLEPMFRLFDTGDRNNSLNLPALVALNQDGTVNSIANPAAVGSAISVYSSGVVLSPPLQTGGLNPIPPAGPLSETPLPRACAGCSAVLYLGSAPGLSTGVQQINLQIPADAPGSRVRAQGIGVGVAYSSQNLLVKPSGVVFIK